MNMNNLFQMLNNPQIKMLLNSKNPQQMAINMIKNSPNANTEIGKNIVNMLEQGDMNAIETYGRNLIQSQGGNPDDLINMFKNMPR